MVPRWVGLSKEMAMNRANWRVGLPQLGQIFFMMDGRGSGDGGGVVGGHPSNSSVTMANVGLEEGAGSEIVAHPLGSNNMETVLGYLRTLPKAMPTYSSSQLTNLAKRLIVLATRTPWVDHPILSSEEGYAEQWQKDIPDRAAFYVAKAVAAVDQASVLSIATFLESRCDEIYNSEALLFMFRSCIATLPQNKHASPIMTLLPTMVCRPNLCEVSKLDPFKQAIEGFSPDQFGEVYRGLREVVIKMKARDQQAQKAGNFILGVCDLYFAKSDEILP